MIRVVSEKFLAADKKEEFLRLAAEHVEKSSAEKGNISFSLVEDSNDPLHLAFIEEWQDMDSLNLHSRSEHATRLVPQMNACAERPGVLCKYKKLF